MKKAIRSLEADSRKYDSKFTQILKDNGIDTTPHRYELKAETYERYGGGQIYTKKFRCEGDYLAYFSMLFHTRPTESEILDFYDSYEDFAEFVEGNPSVEDMKESASRCWWGDGDDFIIYLKNLDTGDILYESDYEEEEYDEEDY